MGGGARLDAEDVRRLLDVDGVLETKLVSLFPGNREHGIPSHQGLDRGLRRGHLQIRIASRTRDHAQALADEVGAVAVESFEEAVRGADVVCACSHSPEPVLRREWLAPGAHVLLGWRLAGGA